MAQAESLRHNNAGLAPTFDALLDADLERVYQAAKDDALRGRAFKILLAHADSVSKLEALAFGGEGNLGRWTADELLAIFDRFRLLSSTENEIRLYRECRNPDFCGAPRVREFYVLALNKAGRHGEAIREASEIIATGGQDALIWGAIAQAYSARARIAQRVAEALASATAPAALDPALAASFAAAFPDHDHAAPTRAQAQALAASNAESARHIFRHGFRDTGAPYPGLGWMFCTLDQLCARATRDEAAADDLHVAEAEVRALKRELDGQVRLVALALEALGGAESRDYWTHAGQLHLAVMAGASDAQIAPILARARAAADADFKLQSTIAELNTVADRWRCIHEATPTGAAARHYARRAEAALAAADALQAERARFRPDAAPGNAPLAAPPAGTREQPVGARAHFLARTINFRTLVGSLTPIYVEGSIGRAGARVPDLLINRRTAGDLVDLIEAKVLPGLLPEQRDDPHAVVNRIRQVVGGYLHLGELQDLQSPSHQAFDVRSDGLIALSGVDHDLRKEARTSTDLTATVLMQTGDCRETMYLNGALFACWQQSQVRRRIARAMACLELGNSAAFQRITEVEIPAILRHQLRGGQVEVYVEGIAMRARYHHLRAAPDDDTALERRYGLEDVRARRPLTCYELETSILEVTYADGSRAWLDPHDPKTGRRAPLAHEPSGDGGVPVLPDAGPGHANVRAIRLLNLVETHALTFLVDAEDGAVALCDGFYNQALFDSPYAFDSGALDLDGPPAAVGLMGAGTRTLVVPDGSRHERPVYLRFLSYSQVDYATGLIEGDLPGTLQFMGRRFKADFRRERRRLDEGISPIPALLRRIQDWHLARDAAVHAPQPTLNRQLARLMLDLAKAHPELIAFMTVTARDALIREGAENERVYLVLSGQLDVQRGGQPVRDPDGLPVRVTAGGVVGEISALRGIPATASVQGDAVVLAISKAEVQAQLPAHPALRESMEEVARQRLAVLAENGYRVV